MPVGPEGIIVESVTPTSAPRGDTVTFAGVHLDLLAGLYLGPSYSYPFTLDSVTATEIVARVHSAAPLTAMLVLYDYQRPYDPPQGLYYAGDSELLYFTALAGVGGWGVGMVRMGAN